jgi:L-Ala-D/L-Glu epimerase
MIKVSHQRFALRGHFTISRGRKTHADVITARIRRGGAGGWGEGVPYARYGESLDSVAAQIASLPADITRAELQAALPPGAARNAVDCALWDLECKQAGLRAWDLAGLAAPGPVATAFTLSLDSPEAMRAVAAAQSHRPILKIKLGTPQDLPRLQAVRAGAPHARLIVDANEGWSGDDYLALAPHLQQLGVVLVEQPLPAGADAILAEIPHPVPICADESAHDAASLAALVGRYDMVNLKLDKTGGLTQGLIARDQARALGLGVMVGCMVGSSLSMAPAVLLAQGAAMADLDGPLLLRDDRAHALRYDAQGVHPPMPGLWG